MLAFSYVPEIKSYVLTVNTAYSEEEVYTTSSLEDMETLYSELKEALELSLVHFITALVDDEDSEPPLNNIEIAKIYLKNRKRDGTL